jgi:hypothetical protein
MSTLHFLDTAINRIQPAIVAAAFGCWVIAAVAMLRVVLKRSTRRYSPVSVVAIICFAGIIGVEFAIGSVFRSAALDEIRPVLAGNIQSVTVNGNAAGRADDLVNAIRNMHSVMGHHSHPTENFQVRLTTSSGQVELDLGRDSDDPHEYWAYYPGFKSTNNNSVAHVFTNALDAPGTAQR